MTETPEPNYRPMPSPPNSVTTKKVYTGAPDTAMPYYSEPWWPPNPDLSLIAEKETGIPWSVGTRKAVGPRRIRSYGNLWFPIEGLSPSYTYKCEYCQEYQKHPMYTREETVAYHYACFDCLLPGLGYTWYEKLPYRFYTILGSIGLLIGTVLFAGMFILTAKGIGIAIGVSGLALAVLSLGPLLANPGYVKYNTGSEPDAKSYQILYNGSSPEIRDRLDRQVDKEIERMFTDD